jgi:hypothetical protein
LVWGPGTHLHVPSRTSGGNPPVRGPGTQRTMSVNAYPLRSLDIPLQVSTHNTLRRTGIDLAGSGIPIQRYWHIPSGDPGLSLSGVQAYSCRRPDITCPDITCPDIPLQVSSTPSGVQASIHLHRVRHTNSGVPAYPLRGAWHTSSVSGHTPSGVQAYPLRYPGIPFRCPGTSVQVGRVYQFRYPGIPH